MNVVDVTCSATALLNVVDVTYSATALLNVVDVTCSATFCMAKDEGNLTKLGNEIISLH